MLLWLFLFEALLSTLELRWESENTESRWLDCLRSKLLLVLGWPLASEWSRSWVLWRRSMEGILGRRERPRLALLLLDGMKW